MPAVPVGHVLEGTVESTMPARVTYEEVGPVAVITMDDGKANVLSPGMLADVGALLDRVGDDHDRRSVVLAGRPGIFSGGFDLGVLRTGGVATLDMLRAGFELSARLLGFPIPVVFACPGHAIAMASFLLLSGDYRIGAAGEYRIVANEVAIGLTMPRAAIEVCRYRLTPAHFNRAVVLAETFTPQGAVTAGFLDRVVPPEQLMRTAVETATAFAALDLGAHAATKVRARADALGAIFAAIEADDADLRSLL